MSNLLLRELYDRNLEALAVIGESIPGKVLQGPLLLSLDSYFRQTRRLMIIGQQTYGWACNYRDIDEQLTSYCKFNLGEKYYSSPFWNFFRKLEKLTDIEPYSSAWSNLNRYDHNKRAPTGEILQKISTLDHILKEEIAILKPDRCFFFTNRKYDYRLTNLYPGLVFNELPGLPRNHFARLQHSELPEISIRAPHPVTIRRRKWETSFWDKMKEML